MNSYKLCAKVNKKYLSLFYDQPIEPYYTALNYELNQLTICITKAGIFCYPDLTGVVTQLKIFDDKSYKKHKRYNKTYALFEATGYKALSPFYPDVKNFRSIKLKSLLIEGKPREILAFLSKNKS